MTRLLRALILLALLVGATLVVASASPLNTPTINTGNSNPPGLNQHIVAAGSSLVISGNHFADDATGKCDAGGGAPTVHFKPAGGGNDQNVVPDPAHCSNTQVQVAVPAALSGAATIVVTDTSGHSSTQAPLVTIQPTAALSRSTGEISSGPLQVIGSNLQPPSQAPGSSLQLTFGGVGTSYSNLTNTGLTFAPPAHSGAVQVGFQVCDNADDGCAQRDNVTIDAGQYTFQPPTVNAANLAHQVVGDRINLDGQYLGTATGTVTFTGGARGQSPAWSESRISVTVPPGAQPGGIAVTVPGINGAIGGASIGLDPKLTGVSPNSASANQAVRITGFNFGASPGSVSVGSAPEAVGQWADQAVTFTISPDTDGGNTILTRADGAMVAVGNLGIVPHLDRVETDRVTAGAQVVVDGASLGANQGTAKLGNVDVAPLLWSRASALLQLPATMAPGTYPLVVTSASGASSNPISLTIVAGPSPRPGSSARPGQPAGIGGAVAPSFDNNHAFVKPIKPPSPVYFNVAVDPHKVKAGEAATVTVTLRLNDKPVKGAAVRLAMLFTPGEDFKFSPDSGVTDENGVFTAKVKTSKNPGDSVVAATSGVFSDQDHVLGTAADGRVASVTRAAPTSNGGFAPLLALGLAAIALIATGVYLNLRSMAAAGN